MNNRPNSECTVCGRNDCKATFHGPGVPDKYLHDVHGPGVGEPIAYLAIMDTRHFTWYGMGSTQQDAAHEILRDWLSAEGTDKSLDTEDKLEEAFGVNFISIAIGGHYHE